MKLKHRPGEFIIGALSLAEALFEREYEQLLVSNEDQDNFVRKLRAQIARENRRATQQGTRP